MLFFNNSIQDQDQDQSVQLVWSVKIR